MPASALRALAFTMALACTAFAGLPTLAQLFIRPESRLWVEGTSSLRSFRCTASRVEGTVATRSAKPEDRIADLQAAVHFVEITVPVASLECGNGTINQQMREALRAGAFPVIRYRVTSHRVTSDSEVAGMVRMNGVLSIAGRESPVGIDAAVLRGPGGVLRVRGSKLIRMTQFEVYPPVWMNGAMRVDDLVTVHFDVVLRT